MQMQFEYLAGRYPDLIFEQNEGNFAVQSPSSPIPPQQREWYQKGQKRQSLANRQMGISLT